MTTETIKEDAEKRYPPCIVPEFIDTNKHRYKNFDVNERERSAFIAGAESRELELEKLENQLRQAHDHIKLLIKADDQRGTF